MTKTGYSIADFSPHLFWDVNKATLDLEKHKRLIVERVIQRGSRHDLDMLLSYYGKDQVREILKQTVWLNEKDMAFIHVYLSIPFNEMKCYTRKRSARYY